MRPYLKKNVKYVRGSLFLLLPDAVVWSTFEDICVSHNQSLRGAAGASGYQECVQLDGLRTPLSFPEEAWTETCTRPRESTDSRLSKQFHQTPVPWIQRMCWGYRSVGERLLIRKGNDSAAPSLKSPSPAPSAGMTQENWKMLAGNKAGQRVFLPSSPSWFYKLGKGTGLVRICFRNLVRLGVYFLVLMSLLPGWECFNSEGTDTWQADTPWYM